jgi:hypothetical protein
MANVISLLDAANTETTGDAFEVTVGRRITFVAFRSGGGTTSPDIQGSLDGENWFTLATADLAVITTPVKYVRGHYSGSDGLGVVTAQALQSDLEDD